jgi:hypothetical protein
MKLLIVFVAATLAAAAQSPTAKIVNTSRSGSEFKVGDRFEIVVTGRANQPVSVRTTRNYAATDWSPVLGWTDTSGRWSTSREFVKADFGSWEQAWTVGDQLANPVVSYGVGAPCIPGGRGMIFNSGAYHTVIDCETATGMQTYATPSQDIPSPETPEQTMGSLIESSGGHSGQHGDDAAIVITRVIGANILSDREIRNALSIIGAAFQNRNVVPPTVNPATLQLLQRLTSEAQTDGVKQEIAKTAEFIQTQ